MVPADSHRVSRAPRYSGCRWAGGALRVRGPHPLWPAVPGRSPRARRAVARPYYPGRAMKTAPGLGSSPFARHYWGNHCCFLFLGVLRCFSSPRSPPMPFARDDRPPGGRVVPFGHPRVTGRLRLTVDFRSLPRPSSPPRAKASAMRPCSLPPTPHPQGNGEGATVSRRTIAALVIDSHFITLTWARKQKRATRVYYSLACPTCQRSIPLQGEGGE